MSAGLRRLLTAVIDAYETATGYTVIIEEHPDGTVTWTDITPTGEHNTTLIPPDDMDPIT